MVNCSNPAPPTSQMAEFNMARVRLYIMYLLRTCIILQSCNKAFLFAVALALAKILVTPTQLRLQCQLSAHALYMNISALMLAHTSLCICAHTCIVAYIYAILLCHSITKLSLGTRYSACPLLRLRCKHMFLQMHSMNDPNQS